MHNLEELLNDIGIEIEISYKKKWYLDNIEHKKAYDKKYYLDNLDKKRNQSKEYNKLHKDKKKEYGKKWSKIKREYIANLLLIKKYKITIEDRNKLFANQNGFCLICNKSKKLAVDHCHKSGKVRGLLCFSCNSKLGWFEKYKEKILNYA